MAGRVVLLGATGFTGRLAAEALVRAGLAPVLAGRSEDALAALVADLAGLGPIDAAPTWQRADANDPAGVRALVRSPDDVLVTTVGPFTRLGRPALDAAIDQGCAYVDSTGEPPFVRAVFERDHEPARRSGARLLTAFGYDYVPGNLAGALAMQDAGGSAVRVEVGYFVRGPMATSSGTRASLAAVMAARPFCFHGGRIAERSGGVVAFEVDGRRLPGLPVGGSEHFALPRLRPGLREVGVYLGWAGPLTRAAHLAAQVAAQAGRLPLVGAALDAGAARAGGSATGIGPSARERAGSATVVAARALDGVGRVLGEALVEGPSPYDLTADLLAWAAAMLATGREQGTGALGPADAFGLPALVDGCAAMGLVRAR
ncbi:MAG: saccharopine dehydrogenase NADP-binding domain-containing protein [Candidatus Nanopelagicales bacterium]